MERRFKRSKRRSEGGAEVRSRSLLSAKRRMKSGLFFFATLAAATRACAHTMPLSQILSLSSVSAMRCCNAQQLSSSVVKCMAAKSSARAMGLRDGGDEGRSFSWMGLASREKEGDKLGWGRGRGLLGFVGGGIQISFSQRLSRKWLCSRAHHLSQHAGMRSTVCAATRKASTSNISPKSKTTTPNTPILHTQPIQRPLNKVIHDDAMACARLGWHHRRGLIPKQDNTDAHIHLMQQGIDFEARYLELNYGDRGVDVVGHGLEALAEETNMRMRDIAELGSVGDALLQATFLCDGVVSRADALEYVGGGEWDVVEVKSCSDKSYAGYLPDLAFTVFAARRAGVKLRKAIMITVNSSFRFGDAPDTLFARIDCTQELLKEEGLVFELEGNSVKGVENVLKVTGGETVPEAVPQVVCKGCALFDACVGKGLSHPIWELPRLSAKKFDMIAEQGLEIKAISSDDLTEPQRRHWECVQKGTWIVDQKGLTSDLSKLTYPVYYLDFESYSSLEPQYPGIAPFEAMVTQYSLHVSESINASPEHVDYLAEGARDCRRDLLEKLIKDLGKEGSIVVYSSYEKTQLNALAELFPDLRLEADGIISRLVDFEKVIKSHVSHPNFRGRSSLKVTLPALVPTYIGQYDGMQISNGAAAAAAFSQLASGLLPADEVQKIRQDLLDYCELDTYAMVELHRALESLADSAQADEGGHHGKIEEKKNITKGAARKVAGARERKAGEGEKDETSERRRRKNANGVAEAKEHKQADEGEHAGTSEQKKKDAAPGGVAEGKERKKADRKAPKKVE